jgi:hypothetical protein
MSWLKSPLVQITGLALAMTAFQVVAVIGGFNALASLPIFVGLFLAYALPVTLVLWIAADMKDRGRTPCFDLPFLLLMAFPISLFWYCISTRGWYGLLLASGLFAVACLPSLATDFVRIAWAIVLP